jgi:thiol-disulfide isomerase/thioredoxin
VKASPASSRDVRALATFVHATAAADRGDSDEALVDLKAYLKDQGRSEKSSDAESAMAVGEAFLQRMIRAGRYEGARALCEFAGGLDGSPKAFREHFTARMGRIALLGKPAPPIAGTDVDGGKVSLAEFKGKVVLVDFWATWCPPCVAAIPRLTALEDRYKAKGFEILGINVDALHKDVKDSRATLADVRHFLVEHGVKWTNVLNGARENDAVDAYGVEEIPASFLVSRDGKVLAFDLSDEELDRAVAKALGDRPGSPPK